MYSVLGLGNPTSSYVFGGKTFHTNSRGSQRKVRLTDMAWAKHTNILNEPGVALIHNESEEVKSLLDI